MSNVENTRQAVTSTKIYTVREFMEQQKELISQVLPKTITPERMLGIFTMILRSSPTLAQCSQKSLIGAVIQSAQLGLAPGNIGYIHLVPFNNKGVMEVQLIIGYKGYIELVNRSGKATILNTEVVYANDIFEYEQGLSPVLRHIPAREERGDKVGVYCIAKNLIANEKVFIYLYKEDVDKVKASSKSSSSNYSPWQNWPEEMWKKTAVKRIAKMLPLSAEEQQALSADETVKTKLEKDMVNLPDETNWKDDPIETTATASTSQEITEEEQKLWDEAGKNK
jgi:recombination protein RecT